MVTPAVHIKLEWSSTKKLECQLAVLSECNWRECERGVWMCVCMITCFICLWIRLSSCFLFFLTVLIGSQNNPCVQRHPGVFGCGRGGGVYGGPDHIYKEPGTRSVFQAYLAEVLTRQRVKITFCCVSWQIQKLFLLCNHSSVSVSCDTSAK